MRSAGVAYVLLAGVALLWLRADPVAGRAAVSLAGDQVGNRARHRRASAGANRAGKNQEHDS